MDLSTCPLQTVDGWCWFFCVTGVAVVLVVVAVHIVGLVAVVAIAVVAVGVVVMSWLWLMTWRDLLMLSHKQVTYICARPKTTRY